MSNTAAVLLNTALAAKPNFDCGMSHISGKNLNVLQRESNAILDKLPAFNSHSYRHVHVFEHIL